MMLFCKTILPFIKKQSLITKAICVSILTNMIMTSFFYVAFHHESQEREIVTLDILKIMDDYSTLAVKTMHDPENMKKSAHALSQRLEELIALNAKEKHLVIMPKQAVIKGAQDITPQIETLLFGKTSGNK